ILTRVNPIPAVCLPFDGNVLSAILVVVRDIERTGSDGVVHPPLRHLLTELIDDHVALNLLALAPELQHSRTDRTVVHTAQITRQLLIRHADTGSNRAKLLLQPDLVRTADVCRFAEPDVFTWK